MQISALLVASCAVGGNSPLLQVSRSTLLASKNSSHIFASVPHSHSSDVSTAGHATWILQQYVCWRSSTRLSFLNYEYVPWPLTPFFPPPPTHTHQFRRMKDIDLIFKIYPTHWKIHTSFLRVPCRCRKHSKKKILKNYIIPVVR